ncbi:3-hydroxyacyl-CoA dehydrogenase NAD-binding domain-containing protein, partial [Staphylococcus epidermidis]|uniref:3-hydroxyacyl-CoA dehydrogenase NAD-binding domain-containing protein n=1 Tax=Staphylococcus epidermidis TaxID=1282 RepID=UPI0037D9C9E0
MPSTTSAIIPSQLQPNLSHPQPLLLPHPFHPLYIFPLLQILPPNQTSQQTTLKPQHIYQTIAIDLLHLPHQIQPHIPHPLMQPLSRQSLHIL